jgi:hypothetical protein
MFDPIGQVANHSLAMQVMHINSTTRTTRMQAGRGAVPVHRGDLRMHQGSKTCVVYFDLEDEG